MTLLEVSQRLKAIITQAEGIGLPIEDVPPSSEAAPASSTTFLLFNREEYSGSDMRFVTPFTRTARFVVGLYMRPAKGGGLLPKVEAIRHRLEDHNRSDLSARGFAVQLESVEIRHDQEGGAMAEMQLAVRDYQ